MRATHKMFARQVTNPCFSIASAGDDFKSALGLVYRSYLQEGLISSNAYGIRLTPYHLLATTDIMSAKIQGEVAATLTLIRDGKYGLPMESAFAAEIADRRGRGIACGEVSCLADRRGCRERSFPMLIKLMSFMAQCAVHRGLEELLITCRPRHAAFYKKYFGFEAISEGARDYRDVSGTQAVGLTIDLVRLQMSARGAYRRLFGKTFSSHYFRRPAMDPALLAELSEIVKETYPADEVVCV